MSRVKKFISASEFAKKLGVTPRAVRLAIQEGRISSAEMIGDQWLIDEKSAMKEWSSVVRPKGPIPSSPEEGGQRLHYLKENPNEITGVEARALKDYFQALNLEVKYLTSTGEYIHFNEAKKELEAVASKIKLILDAVPKELYLEIAHLVDSSNLLKIEEITKKLLNKALIKVCDDIQTGAGGKA